MTLQHYCCHTEEEVDGMVEAVSEMVWNPLVNQTLGVISCAPVVNKAGQQPYPKGSRSIDIGLSVSSKPREGAHFEMLRIVRMVRHYSSKEFVPVIKIEPRINKFVLRLAVVDDQFDIARAITLLQEELDKMSKQDKALPHLQKFQFGHQSMGAK